MWIDVTLLIILGLSFLTGFSRGIIKTLFRLLALLVGVIGTIRFAPSVTSFLKQAFQEDSSLMFLAGLVATFGIIFVIIRFLGRGLENMLETANLNFINRIAGGAFTAAISVLIYSVLLNFFLKSSYSERELQQVTADSSTYVYLEKYPAQAYRITQDLRPAARTFWDYTQELFDELQNATERTESEDQIIDLN